jgi:plasmid maintenance system antidote protein VapI
MKTEYEMSITIPLSKAQKKVAEATRVTRRTLCRLLKEGENVETGVAMAFLTPLKLVSDIEYY